MGARAERQASAEEADDHVGVAAAAHRRKRDLVRPLAIHHAFAQIALAIDHAKTSVGRRPRSRDAGANRGKRRGARGRRILCLGVDLVGR